MRAEANRFCMRGVVLALAAAFLPAAALAAGVQEMTMAVGTAKDISVAFEVKGFDVVNKEVVLVKLLNPRTISVQATQQGKTDFTITGEGGAAQTFRVMVVPDIEQVMRSVRKALEDVPEVDLSVVEQKVMLKGEISDLSHWTLVKKVVDSMGTSACMDVTALRMPPELVLQLKNALMANGFTIAKDAEPVGKDAPGRLKVEATGRTLHISGSVYSEKDTKKIEEVVAAQPWLKSSTETADADEAKFWAQVNVMVLPTMLEVDVAFIGVTENEQQKIGVNLFDAGLLTIQAGGALAGDVSRAVTREGGSRTTTKKSGYSSSGTYSVASELAGTMQLFVKENPSRMLDRGHLTFMNGAADWKEYHSGGTLKVRVVSDNTAELEDIDYGLIMKVKGGLIDDKNVATDVELELSAPEQIKSTGDWDLKRNTVKTTVMCQVGHTLIMGGTDQLFQGVDTSGTPILRSVPLLKRFFSSEESNREHKRMLILLSPQIVGAPQPARPLSEETFKVLQDSSLTPSETLEKKHTRRFFFF